MTDKPITIITQNIGKELIQAASRATSYVTIVSPYITKAAIDRFVPLIAQSAKLTIVTRWRVRDVALGVSQPSILDAVQAFPHRLVILQQNLHAKIYGFDDRVAYLGSSNTTEAGLGFAHKPNLEVMARIEPAPQSLLAYVRYLETTGIPATQKLRTEIELAADALKIEMPSADAEVLQQVDSEVARGGIDLAVFPHSRHPEDLYERYLSITSCKSRDERHAVLDDLSALNLSDGLAKSEFNEAIATKLKEDPILVQFDLFLSESRRFGQMTEWLKSNVQGLPEDHKAVQRRLQTILRWLHEFLPERYEFDQPNYTEIVRRI